MNRLKWWKTGEVKGSYLGGILRDDVFEGGVTETHGWVQSNIGDWIHVLNLLTNYYDHIHFDSKNLKRIPI